MLSPASAFPAKENEPARISCAGLAILLMAWLWAAGLAFTYTANAFFLASFGPDQTRLATAGTAAGYAVLLLLPLGIMALFWKAEPYRSILQAWAGAAVFALLATPLHLFEPYAVHLRALLHLPVALIYLLFVWLLAGLPRFSFTPRPKRRSWLLALLAATVFSYPWLAFGALGTPLDTLLHLLSALAVGTALAFLLEVTLLPWITAPHSRPPGFASRFPRFFVGGLAVGTTLVIFSSGMGFGYFGIQLMLMLSLPMLGFAAAAAAGLDGEEDRPSGIQLDRLGAAAILIGLGAAAPLILINPRDLYLVVSLGPGEILAWSIAGAFLSALAGAALSMAIFIALNRTRKLYGTGGEPLSNSPTAERSNPASRGLLLLAGAALTGAMLIYLSSGRTGFHGDTLFVIMAEQADLAQPGSNSSPQERRQHVYEILTTHADRTQTDLRQSLERINVGYTPYYIVNGLEVKGGPIVRAWLNTRADVDRVLFNPWMRPLPAARSPIRGSQQTPPDNPWNLEGIGAGRVWREFGITGEGIVVGQSDSGVDWEHPELAASYRGRGNGLAADHDYNWLDPWYHEPLPIDYLGHGTHTLGTVLGETTGVAPGATWFGCANLSRNMGNPALYLGCMQFMFAPFPGGGDPFTQGRPDLGAHIVNNSWGCPQVEGCDPTSLQDAVYALRQAGIFVVVSAGNDGPFCGSLNHPPAIYEQVFSVGAVDREGQLASFSSIGPVTSDSSGRVKPDLLAPGVRIMSAMPGGTYSPLSGTSMAGPHASGVIALMWSANPALIGDIDRTEEILIRSARTYTGPLPNCPGVVNFPSTAAGYGVLDAFAAVQLALEENSP